MDGNIIHLLYSMLPCRSCVIIVIVPFYCVAVRLVEWLCIRNQCLFCDRGVLSDRTPRRTLIHNHKRATLTICCVCSMYNVHTIRQNTKDCICTYTKTDPVFCVPFFSAFLFIFHCSYMRMRMSLYPIIRHIIYSNFPRGKKKTTNTPTHTSTHCSHIRYAQGNGRLVSSFPFFSLGCAATGAVGRYRYNPNHFEQIVFLVAHIHRCTVAGVMVFNLKICSC